MLREDFNNSTSHVFRTVLLRNLTQTVQHVFVYYFCHTLATSVTSRKARCCKLGVCPSHTIYTQLSKTQCTGTREDG